MRIKTSNLLKRTYFAFSERHFSETIYALSTGYGKSAIAVIRISGSDAQKALLLTKKESDNKQFETNYIYKNLKIKPRFAHFKHFY